MKHALTSPQVSLEDWSNGRQEITPNDNAPTARDNAEGPKEKKGKCGRKRKFKMKPGETCGRFSLLSCFSVGRYYWWKCLCVCGREKSVREDHLANGKTVSCGCIFSERPIKHGQCRTGAMTPEFKAWCEMRQRCNNPKKKHYSDYGGRGITVCARWSEFSNFFEDMGERPSSSHSLDRKENDGNYCKKNCRWATRIEQNNNRRNSFLIVLGSQCKTAANWARDIGVRAQILRRRIRDGWTAERTLKTPSLASHV